MLRLDRPKMMALPAALACLLLLLVIPGASADGAGRTLAPKKGKVFHGVTDTGDISGFTGFTEAVGRKPAVIQTFHPWGNSFDKALPRWREARARPMLHVTTRTDSGVEIITPLQIANGKGDDYLIQLNQAFKSAGTPAYLRPMGEPNRCLNMYAGVDCDGNIRGGPYKFEYYRSAFRRIAIIVRGGGTREEINGKLRAIGLPKLQLAGKAKALPERLPRAPVSIIWSPLPNGAPGTKANRPKSYWPGGQWVDWVGTTYDSRFSKWKFLKRFYRTWAVGRKKPMTLAEWWLHRDDPKFVKGVFRFMKRNSRARMMVFYQDFGTSNSYRLQNYERARKAYATLVGSPRFPRFAPRFPRPQMEPPDGGISPR